jgi:hypothetical protein
LVFVAALVRGGQALVEIPVRWSSSGPVENMVRDLSQYAGPEDWVVVNAPFDAATWYYSHLYGIPEKSYSPHTNFDALWVIVNAGEGESIESVLLARGPDLDLVDLDSAQRIMNHGFLDVYTVQHR